MTDTILGPDVSFPKQDPEERIEQDDEATFRTDIANINSTIDLQIDKLHVKLFAAHPSEYPVPASVINVSVSGVSNSVIKYDYSVDGGSTFKTGPNQPPLDIPAGGKATVIVEILTKTGATAVYPLENSFGVELDWSAKVVHKNDKNTAKSTSFKIWKD